ncbi:Hypoxanthine/guanine phosphoribosyltransferase [uncultured archaeon]|nr:Hypoxanthine/guanine phosphoribosyltransferase [uncultured archaeon]
MNRKFIEYLVRNKVLKFGDFTLKSGRKSPYFITTGALNSGKTSYELGAFFAQKIAKVYGSDFDTIFGPAYKGIPLAVSVSIGLYKKSKMDKTWLFDRKEAKEHGDKSAFVGDGPRDGQKMVMVDDVFTTGGTKDEAIKKLKAAANVDIKGIVIAVDREEKGNAKNAIKEFEESSGVRVHAVEKISSIFKYLHNREIGGQVHVNDQIFAAYKEYVKQYGARYE